ncbi:DUF309 domain-containing protein [Sulfurisphaera ohwakuensis]|uniref:Putative metal-dependent hydrolase n=1 Tax=Sulfurisphaera ohwakuensis TaxID=69656 RepID=A0A7J9RN49_SULOH|nr:DUF309 domain-containing protein [Sulfurisphaera ohwakuensis]MBB5252313.1 putative metal-dependent hydrolase [Sulfurisphaera ohwakuensis]
MKRVIYFYPKDCCDYTIKNKLRQMGINVIDVRICKYVEIDFYEDERIISILGKPLFTSEKLPFEKLFFNGRFWESHEILEEKWRVEKDEKKKKYLQALILISASMIKYCKGQKEISDSLLDRALSLISELPEELLPFFYISFCLDT